jgi:hypothetical protein
VKTHVACSLRLATEKKVKLHPYLPAAQAVHAVAAPVEYLPVLQLSEQLDPRAETDEYLPAAQPVHPVE